MVLKERMRVVVQVMGLMDVLCDAIDNILKWKILQLLIWNWLKIMTHPSVEYILIIINDEDIYLIWQVIPINFLSEKRLQNDLYSIFQYCRRLPHILFE